MIMHFVNTEVTSKECFALIFFPHTQRIIYHFEDNYRSRIFLRMFLTPFFICKGYHEMHVYSYEILLLPNSASSPNLNTKYMCSWHFLATGILSSSATYSLFCTSQDWSWKWLCLSTRKTITSYLSGFVEANIALQAPGIVVDNLEPSWKTSILIFFLENLYCWGKWWRTIPFKLLEDTPNAIPIRCSATTLRFLFVLPLLCNIHIWCILTFCFH